MNHRTKYLIEKMVQDTRKELAIEHDVIAKNPGFRGLCDEASTKMLEKLTEYWMNSESDVDLQVYLIHGEQRHSPMSPSKYWIFQHTFVCAIINHETIYIDPTSSQFQWLYSDIPDYYIGRKFPKWYYNDRKNPAWNGITAVINEKITIKRSWKDGSTVYDGIIEFIQYEVWGRICDFIRSILRKEDIVYEG